MPPTPDQSYTPPLESPSHTRLIILFGIFLLVAGGALWYILSPRPETPLTTPSVSTKPTPAEIQAALTKRAASTTPALAEKELRQALTAPAKKSSAVSPTSAEIQAALTKQAK